MNEIVINSLSKDLDEYRLEIARSSDPEARDDYAQLAAIIEDLIAAMLANDIDKVKINLLSFSRQVSDSFFQQPPAFHALAARVTEIKRLIF